MTSKKKDKVEGELLSTLFFIPVKPQPAARPRISKFGNYYPKGYTDFRKEIYRFFKTLDMFNEGGIDKVSFKVELEFFYNQINQFL